jgi:hypothetical protein
LIIARPYQEIHHAQCYDNGVNVVWEVVVQLDPDLVLYDDLALLFRVARVGKATLAAAHWKVTPKKNRVDLNMVVISVTVNNWVGVCH